MCTEAVRGQMNATLAQIDPTSTGDVMLAEVALASAPYVTVGRWSSWAMTDDHRAKVLREYAQQGWRPLIGAEGRTILPADTVPPWGTQRFYLFDGVAWPRPWDALDRLGLVPRLWPDE